MVGVRFLNVGVRGYRWNDLCGNGFELETSVGEIFSLKEVQIMCMFPVSLNTSSQIYWLWQTHFLTILEVRNPQSLEIKLRWWQSWFLTEAPEKVHFLTFPASRGCCLTWLIVSPSVFWVAAQCLPVLACLVLCVYHHICSGFSLLTSFLGGTLWLHLAYSDNSGECPHAQIFNSINLRFPLPGKVMDLQVPGNRTWASWMGSIIL